MCGKFQSKSRRVASDGLPSGGRHRASPSFREQRLCHLADAERHVGAGPGFEVFCIKRAWGLISVGVVCAVLFSPANSFVHFVDVVCDYDLVVNAQKTYTVQGGQHKTRGNPESAPFKPHYLLLAWDCCRKHARTCLFGGTN